jgi:hypothetical protein
MQAEEALSTEVSYETRIEAGLDITSAQGSSNICCSCNKYGLIMAVKESRIIVLRIADIENGCGSSSPADVLLKSSHQVEMDETVIGLYMSPLEDHVCVVLDSGVIVVRVDELMNEVSHVGDLVIW